MTLTLEEAHDLAHSGALLLSMANDDDLWRDFRALTKRARVIATATAITIDAAEDQR